MNWSFSHTKVAVRMKPGTYIGIPCTVIDILDLLKTALLKQQKAYVFKYVFKRT